MIKLKYLLIILLLSGLSACVSPAEKAAMLAEDSPLNVAVEEPVTVPFDEDQAKQAMLPGPTTIKGVLYEKLTKTGGHAGSDPTITKAEAVNVPNYNVYLYPVTDHLLEYLRLEAKNAKRLDSLSFDRQLRTYILDPRAYKYAISAKADNNGSYQFTSLKPGRYYLTSDKVAVTITTTKWGQNGTYTSTDAWGYTSTIPTRGEIPFQTETVIVYSTFIDIEPGQTEIVLDSRMRKKI